MYRVSGLDKLDAIEILSSTTTIQAIGNLQKMPIFPSPGKCKKLCCQERLYKTKVSNLAMMIFFCFGDCIFQNSIQNSIQNAAMLMVLLLLLLLLLVWHPNRAKQHSKRFSCSLQGASFGTKTKLKRIIPKIEGLV